MRRFLSILLIFTLHYADIVLLGGVLLSPSEVFAADYVCGQDLDTDEYIDKSGETSNCVATAQGQLCTIGAVQCASSAVCPLGGYTCSNGACTQPGTCSSVQVPITQYQCPSTGQIYDDSAACGNNCTQTASCDAQYGWVSRDQTWSPPLGPFGHVISTYDDFRGGPQSVCDYLLPGSTAVTANCYLADAWCSEWGTDSETGSSICLTARGCDYLRNGGWGYSTSCPDQGWCNGGGISSITCRQSTWELTGYSCPLGSYPCSGSPQACAAGQACVAYNSSITKYQCSLTGSQYDTQDQCTSSCFNTAPCGTNYSCPLGSQYACMDNSGVMQCSPNQCVDLEGTPPIETQIDSKMLQDDGPKDANTGECLGQRSIFTGKGSRCRPKGKTVGYANNCCEGSDAAPITEDQGSYITTVASNITTLYDVAQIAYYGTQVASGSLTIAGGTMTASGNLSGIFLSNQVTLSGNVASAVLSQAPVAAAPIQLTAVGTGVTGVTTGTAAGAGLSLQSAVGEYLVASFNPVTIAVAVVVYLVTKIYFGGGCDANDLNTVLLRDSKLCHYIGDYCEKKWPIFGCVQKAQGYCCYNRKLGRIITEQGRPQLQSFGANGGWGTPQNPNCRGFTPEEFQMLDFAKMDLSEYFGEIQTKMQEQIQNNMSDKVNQFYQNTR